MTVTALTPSPLYPTAGARVTLNGTSSAYQDEDIEWTLFAAPSKSRLALGRIVENHPTMARVMSLPIVLHPAVTRYGKAAFITRTLGSWVDDGFKVGMRVAISGTASNDRTVTIAAVNATTLTLAPLDVLVSESVTATLATAYDATGTATNVIVPDVAGEYTLVASEYFTWPGDGGLEGAPLSAAQKRLMSTASFTLNVGADLGLPIEPVNGHASTLRITVVGDTVRAAALVNPKTELARVAALDSTVAAAVTALVGVAVNSLDADFITTVNAGCAAYEAHRILIGIPVVHASADSTNAMLRETANSVPAAVERLNDWAAKLVGHMQALTSGGTWHGADDGKNVLQVAPRATTLGQAVVLLADLRNRVYRRHIAQTASPGSHASADALNDVSAVASGTIAYAIVQYLDFVASTSPGVAAGESEGIGDAIAAWGFSRTA